MSESPCERILIGYRQPSLDAIEGATSKEMLVCNEDVQVLHGFDSQEHAAANLESEMYTKHVASGLAPYFQADPEIRIFTVAG